jgi:hypothetical protein
MLACWRGGVRRVRLCPRKPPLPALPYPLPSAKALAYLTDVRVESLTGEDAGSFKLVFSFAQNPFFSNAVRNGIGSAGGGVWGGGGGPSTAAARPRPRRRSA